MDINMVLDILSKAKRGTIHTIVYEKREKQKGLADFRQEVCYQIRLADYENMSKVKEYRANTGVGPCNPAVQNEVSTDIFGVYLNPKTNKIKLRVPVNGTKVLWCKYFIGDKEVTEEEYYTEYEARGYLIPKKTPSKTGVEFRSFDLERSIDFK